MKFLALTAFEFDEKKILVKQNTYIKVVVVSISESAMAEKYLLQLILIICIIQEIKLTSSFSSDLLLTPEHLVVMNSWHRLWTTHVQIWHW